MKLGAIILAAGGSSRMGRPKGLCEVDGVPLLRAHVGALAAIEWTGVVLGSEVRLHRHVLPDGIAVIENPSWRADTMSDSLRVGLREAPNLDLCLVTPVDVPPADADTLAALLTMGASAVPIDPSGREGHPVLLDAAAMRRVLDGPVPGGLRALLAAAPRVPVSQWDVGLDFDDPPALAAWLSARLTRGSPRDN